MNEIIFTARIKYSKLGLIRFIGHLDTVRAVTRALRCSGLPIKFSEGFSPHPKMSFGPALPLGFSSDSEYLDVELLQKVSAETIVEKVAPNLPRGLQIQKVEPLSFRPSSLSKIIDHARYRITLPIEHFTDPDAIKSSIAINADEKIARMQKHIDNFECVKKNDQTCEFDVTLKDVNKSAPSLKKIFAALFDIDLFDIDCARLHRLDQSSAKSKLL
jgi:radical SAM-linked protein